MPEDTDWAAPYKVKPVSREEYNRLMKSKRELAAQIKELKNLWQTALNRDFVEKKLATLERELKEIENRLLGV